MRPIPFHIWAKMEFEAYNQECHILREKLSLSEDHLEQERQQRTAEIARLRSHIAQVQINNSKNEEALEEKYRILLLDISRLQADINVLSGERDMLSLQLNEKNMAYSPTVFEDALRSKENLKLRMRLHSTQEKLDMCRGRYKEVSRDMSVMHKKYEEASANLKKQLADYGTVILQLKKELQLGGGCSRNC